MKESVEALVDGELLSWARNSAGLSTREAARKIQLKEEILQNWESNQTRPTVTQLRKLANAYKRPIAIFYLPEPPRDFQPIHDFRRLAYMETPRLSPRLRYEIRRAYERREIALELFQDLDIEAPMSPLKAIVSDEPEALASKMREQLRITRHRQVSFSDDRESFNWWKMAIEKFGVLVFQATGVKVSEMRGFSIAQKPLPVVVLNNKDSVRGRTFTLLHEFVHIMLESDGLCDLSEEYDPYPKDPSIEVYCNRVAGAIIVNRDDLLVEAASLGKKPGDEWSDSEINKLADKYRVSREVVTRRLLICSCVTADFYREKRRQFEQEYANFAKDSGEGFIPPDRLAILRAGYTFVELALNGYHSRKITASDLSDFLEVRLKHVPKIEQLVLRRMT